MVRFKFYNRLVLAAYFLCCLFLLSAASLKYLLHGNSKENVTKAAVSYDLPRRRPSPTPPPYGTILDTVWENENKVILGWVADGIAWVWRGTPEQFEQWTEESSQATKDVE